MLFLALVLCAAGPVASAGNDPAAHPPQSAGLMWNRSGLPAVFPLQVKTPPGQDYFLTLIDESTDNAVLAAFIKGGEFFKVLVPPGVYWLRFAGGYVWRGEDDLFGPGTNTDLFALCKPLTFETRGIGIKAGHIVNLLERRPGQLAQVTLKDQFICQFISLELPLSPYSTSTRERARGVRHQWLIRSLTGHAAGLDERIVNRYQRHTDLRRYFTMPRYEVRSQYCGQSRPQTAPVAQYLNLLPGRRIVQSLRRRIDEETLEVRSTKALSNRIHPSYLTKGAAPLRDWSYWPAGHL